MATDIQVTPHIWDLAAAINVGSWRSWCSNLAAHPSCVPRRCRFVTDGHSLRVARRAMSAQWAAGASSSG